MMIDGRPITASGTLVLGGGQTGQLSLPFGVFTLVFNEGGSANLQVTTNPFQIIFTGADNPLGMGGTFNLPTANGTTYLTIAAYAIGNGAGATRIIHYTVS